MKCNCGGLFRYNYHIWYQCDICGYWMSWGGLSYKLRVAAARLRYPSATNS